MPARAFPFKSLLRFCLIMIWTASAYAAEPALAAASITDIPLRAMGAAVFLALIGGAARTATKMADPKIVVASVPLVILADVLTSVAVGTATFFLVAWREWHPLLQAFTITVAGWGGSTILENYVGTFMRRLTGAANGNP